MIPWFMETFLTGNWRATSQPTRFLSFLCSAIRFSALFSSFFLCFFTAASFDRIRRRFVESAWNYLFGISYECSRATTAKNSGKGYFVCVCMWTLRDFQFTAGSRMCNSCACKSIDVTCECYCQCVIAWNSIPTWIICSPSHSNVCDGHFCRFQFIKIDRMTFDAIAFVFAHQSVRLWVMGIRRLHSSTPSSRLLIFQLQKYAPRETPFRLAFPARWMETISIFPFYHK